MGSNRIIKPQKKYDANVALISGFIFQQSLVCNFDGLLKLIIITSPEKQNYFQNKLHFYAFP